MQRFYRELLGPDTSSSLDRRKQVIFLLHPLLPPEFGNLLICHTLCHHHRLCCWFFHSPEPLQWWRRRWQRGTDLLHLCRPELSFQLHLLLLYFTQSTHSLIGFAIRSLGSQMMREKTEKLKPWRSRSITNNFLGTNNPT